MCGRCRRTTAEEEIARHFKIPIPPQLDVPINYNIASTQNIRLVRKEGVSRWVRPSVYAAKSGTGQRASQKMRKMRYLGYLSGDFSRG
jgi:putative SOS response-associated peptidase YedK